MTLALPDRRVTPMLETAFEPIRLPADPTSSPHPPMIGPASEPKGSTAGGGFSGGLTVDVPDLSGFDELRIWAESYADAISHRIALFNRLGIKADGTPTKSGTAIDLDSFDHILQPVLATERHIQRELLLTYRRVAPPGVREWQQATFGIGEHLLARLLGSLGHPRWATPYHWEGTGKKRVLVADDVYERSLRQLWAYCGHGAPLRRQKGMSADDVFLMGSPHCKMLTRLLALAAHKCRVTPTPGTAFEPSIVTADPTSSPHPPKVPTASEPKGSTAGGGCSADHPSLRTAFGWPRQDTDGRHLRRLYERRRAHTAVTHPEWTPLHSYNDALRIVGKQILAELWAAAAPDRRVTPIIATAFEPRLLTADPTSSPHPPKRATASEPTLRTAGGDCSADHPTATTASEPSGTTDGRHLREEPA